MMKILLLIFSLYLISGPVAHSDVIGYSGGGVIIITGLKWNNKYICKKVQTDCVEIIRSNTRRSSVQKDRFMLYRNTYGYLIVLIKKLQPQDAGRYTIGSDYQQNSNVDLEVRNDSCCSKTKTIKAYAGENIILTCNYPEHFEENIKYFDKLDENSVIQEVVNTEKGHQNNGKFSISDEKRKKCIDVSISDVREEDEGVYLCAVSVSPEYGYFSFTEIELQVTDTTGTSIVTSTGPTETSSDEAHFSFSVIIIVCICVTLLLIGGFGLILYLQRCRQTQGSTSFDRRHNNNNQAAADYENYSAYLQLYENHNIRMTSVQQNLHLYSNQLHSLYQSLDPSTNQSDSVYHSLDPTNNQLDSTSQSPDSLTNQSDSVYQCLNRKTQSNSVYHTLQS